MRLAEDHSGTPISLSIDERQKKKWEAPFEVAERRSYLRRWRQVKQERVRQATSNAPDDQFPALESSLPPSTGQVASTAHPPAQQSHRQEGPPVAAVSLSTSPVSTPATTAVQSHGQAHSSAPFVAPTTASGSPHNQPHIQSPNAQPPLQLGTHPTHPATALASPSVTQSIPSPTSPLRASSLSSEHRAQTPEAHVGTPPSSEHTSASIDPLAAMRHTSFWDALDWPLDRGWSPT